MEDVLKSLESFIDAAEKSRKYPRNTAVAYKSVLNLFAQELNDEEKKSLEKVCDNIGQIYNNVFNKNKSKMTVATLETYRRRFNSLISDYRRYGMDSSGMAKWRRPLRSVSPKRSMNGSEETKVSDPSYVEDIPVQSSHELSRFELSLRPGIKAVVVVPSDIKKSEVGQIKKLADFLEDISVE
jgi:hypothetical protein